MVSKPLHIGLVGCGSRGLSVLERLLSIAETRPQQPLVIDIFDPNVFGTGIHWPNQPNYLLLNTVAGQLGVFPDAAAFGTLHDARERSCPDFLEWCRFKGITVDPKTGLVANQGRAVESEDFLPRRLLGDYLADSFSSILSSAPAWVAVRLHPHPVVGLCTHSQQGYQLKLPSSDSVNVDRLILTVGHTGRVRADEEGRVGDIYPLPGSLDGIAAGEAVLLEGLGLGAMDALAALTSGRGGTYHRMADASHVYFPSGEEPLIYIQSRDGLPFRVRPNGLSWAPRHKPIFLTSTHIDALRQQVPNGQLDFERDVLPRMLLEMRAAGMAVLHGKTNPARHLEVLEKLRTVSLQTPTDTCESEGLLRHYEALTGAIDPQALILHSLPPQVNSHNYHTWIYDAIETDLHEARIGRAESPVKAAIEVWRDMRDRLREAVDFDGLTEASHRQFYGRWHKAINRLVAGPQKERHADLLALSDAGLLTFLPPGAVPAAKPCWRVAGYLQSTGVHDSDCVPVRDLARLGLIRARTDVPGLDGIDVNAACNPHTSNGEPVRNLWVLGPLAEGSCYYNHYVASAGAPSRLFIDAHKAASAILDTGAAP
jgi:uncharacterized NAD(P)/FAD-binding protein YdhS